MTVKYDRVGKVNPTIKLHVGQPEQMFVLLSMQTERFDHMSEHCQHSPASLVALIALCERIEAEAPHLQLMGLYEYPRPFVKVKDTVHGIVVGFSSEADYVTYCQITARKGA